MQTIIALLICCTAWAVEDMPGWVLPGILYVETHSYYNDDGSIHYTNKKRGSHGERSSFQITYRAFKQVRQPGEQFWQIETDQVFAEEIATRYLFWLREHSVSWRRAVEAYNAGPRNRSPEYLSAVLAAGQ
jgi:hypothetical protein